MADFSSVGASNSALSKLTIEIAKLNRHLSDRIDAVENRINSEIFTSEGLQELTRINKAISDNVRAAKQLQIEQKEQQLAAQRPPTFQNSSYSSAFQAPSTKAICKWFRKAGDIQALTNEERSLIDFNRMDMDMYSTEQKVMVSSAADLGGFFAGTDLSDKFIMKLFLVSPLRQYADVQTIGGEKLLIPSEGATDTNIFWSDEQTGFVASPDPNLGMIEIFARELNGYLKISRQNLEDSVFDVESFILKRLSRQFAQKEGAAFINGNGIARPEGLLTVAALSGGGGMNIYTTPSADAQVLKPNHLINLMHAGKSRYRATGTWLMSNSTIGICRLFADTTTRPLWNVFGDSFQETLFGKKRTCRSQVAKAA